MAPRIIDSTDRLHMEVDRHHRLTSATFEAFQDIPSSFTDAIAAERTHQDRKFAADDVKIASLPAALVDHWYRNGFSVWDPNVTPQDIINRLMREDLTAFLCTSKSFG